jgi:hypothetical protein
MVAYAFRILPIVCHNKSEIPEVQQPWYAYDPGAGGRTFVKIREYFGKLNEYGPPQGYFPREPIQF